MTTLQSGLAAPNASESAAHSGEEFADLPVRDRVCRGAIAHFGRFGFDQSMLEMSIANDVDVQTRTELFGSIEGLRKGCDEYVASSIGTAKTEALSCHDPATWIQQITQSDSFAAALTYLARSLQSGDEFGRALMQQMTDDAFTYLEAAVRAGTIKPSHDP
jgi:TetR/AcrR family transcriptional regulator, regulator of cefoperazone and chloramphenicol sensitivity